MSRANGESTSGSQGDVRTYFGSWASGEETTDDGKISVNLQKTFWQHALGIWQRMKDDQALRTQEECALVLVCVGTSLSQLLGQNAHRLPNVDSSRRTQPPKDIFRIVLSDPSMQPTMDNMRPKPKDILDRFNELIEAYDDVRHFGPCKHEKVGELDFNLLTEFMKTAQTVWTLMIQRAFRDKNEVPEKQLELFHNEFEV